MTFIFQILTQLNTCGRSLTDLIDEDFGASNRYQNETEKFKGEITHY